MGNLTSFIIIIIMCAAAAWFTSKIDFDDENSEFCNNDAHLEQTRKLDEQLKLKK